MRRVAAVVGVVVVVGSFVASTATGAAGCGTPCHVALMKAPELEAVLKNNTTDDVSRRQNLEADLGSFIADVRVCRQTTRTTTTVPPATASPTTTTTPIQPAVVRAFDTTAVILDQAWFDARYAQGFRLYILHSTKWGTGKPWWRTEIQTQMALNAGLMVAGYTRDPSFWREGIQAFGPYTDDLEFFSLDIEDHPGVPATRAMVNGIATMGVQPVIYTDRRMWFDVQGATDNDFADVPLWDSDVTGNVTLANQRVSLQNPPAVPYAGWNTPTNMRIGVQQSFDTVIDGIPVDLNTFILD